VQLLMGSRNTEQRSRQQQLQLHNAAGYTALMAAAAAGHAQVVDAMLLAGADMHSSVMQVSWG
jgi:ankyrin repeat protein